MTYNLYPAIDENFNFPPVVREAVSLSEEMSTKFGGAVRVSKYGTNSAAFLSAASEAGSGGTIFLPKKHGPYTITTPITLTEVNIQSDGATINVPLGYNSAPETAAITIDSPTGSYSGIHVSGFRLVGPGNRTLGTKVANAVGIRVNNRAMAQFENVEVRYFDKGFAYNNILGHIYAVGVNANNNYYGVYLENNDNDYLFDKCLINGNTFANFGCPSNEGWGALIVRDSHIGFAPYAFYQEAAPVAQGSNQAFISTALFSHARFEAIGNAAFWSEATVDATNFSLFETIDIDNPGFSWATADGTYNIASRPRTYAMYVPQTNRQIRIRNGNYPFTHASGTGSAIRIKKPGHSVFELIGNGAAIANVSSDTGAIGSIYAYEYPVNGAITHNGDLNVPLLKFGTAGGYISPGGSDLRRFGADTAYLFADISSDFRWRDSNNAYSTIGRVTSAGIAMPKYYLGAAGSQTGPTWTSGTGIPAAAEPNGSFYLRSDGTNNSTLYVRVAGAWVIQTILTGTAANAVLDMGTSTGYIRPQGSDARRFGGDAGGIYADYSSATGGFVVRDSATNYSATATFSSAGLEVHVGGVILKSPNGTRYKITVGDDGALTTTAL